jgi:O-antigen/teichoic acid export membrane protein
MALSPPPAPDTGEAAIGHLKLGLADLLKRFVALLASNSLRDWLLGLFFLYLARNNPKIFGYFMIAISAGAIILKVVEFGFNDYLVKYLGSTPKQSITAVGSVNALKIVLLTVATLGLAIFCQVMAYSKELSLFVILVGLGMGLRSLSDSLYMVFRLLGRQITESAIKVGAMVISLIWAFILLALGLGPIWVGSLLIVNSLVNVLFAVIALKGNIKTVFHPSWVPIKQLVKGSFPFTLIACFAILANKTNIFFLQNASGTAAVAEYMTSWIIVDGVSCAMSAHLLTGVIYPLLSRHQAQPLAHSLPFIRRTFVWLMILAWPVCLLLYSQSDLLIGLFYGSGYAGAPALQRVLVWTIPVAFCQNVCFCLALARGSAMRLAVIFGVGLAANILLDILLVPDAGSLGAAWVILATKFTICALVFAYCQKTLAITSLREWAAILGMALLLAMIYLILRAVLPALAAVMGAISIYIIVLLKQRQRLRIEDKNFAVQVAVGDCAAQTEVRI